jgi:hypothetical protein
VPTALSAEVDPLPPATCGKETCPPSTPDAMSDKSPPRGRQFVGTDDQAKTFRMETPPRQKLSEQHEAPLFPPRS